MTSQIKPICLLADSQLLFCQQHGVPHILPELGYTDTESLSAVYFGASNDFVRDYYLIFKAAMENIGVTQCMEIQTSMSDLERNFLEQADIILLAGGDVRRGWEVFNEMALPETLMHCYHNGAFIIGISAGAVQLGLGWLEENETPAWLKTFCFVPYCIGVHDEKSNWQHLEKTAHIRNESSCIGIPSGGGMLFYPNQDVEPLQCALKKIAITS